MASQQFTTSDSYTFHLRRYAPPAAPLGRIVFLHGTRSHGGWYVGSCTKLAEAGYQVHFLDRRGAGLNTANRGDTPSFRRLIDDVAEYLTLLRQQPTPIALAGISWGGKVAAAVAAVRPDLVDRLLLLCPGFVPKVGPQFRDKLRIAFSRFTHPTRLFPVPLNDPELFTASPEWQQFLRDDPHGLVVATARFLFHSARLDLFLKRVAGNVTTPTLLLLAEHDRVIDNARTREYVKRFANAKIDAIEYAGSHHTLEFEPAGHPYLGDVLKWLGEPAGS